MWIWKTLNSVVLISVLVHVSTVRGQVCVKLTTLALRNCTINYCCKCTISSFNDYASIPGNAVAMDLAFSSGSTGLDATARLPNLFLLSELQISLSNLGPSPVIPSGFFSDVGHQLDMLTLYHGAPSWVAFSAKLVNGSFSGLSNLTRLNAAALGLTELPVGVFGDLVRLSYLDLSRNSLTGVADGIFAQQRQLVTLFLPKNQISSLANVSFAGLEALKTLDLTGNRIRNLGEDHDFLAMRNLTRINLGSNGMTRIDPYAFQGLRRLAQLFLDTNNLTNLTANVFHDLPNLVNLDLSSNVLERLSETLFSGLGSLEFIYLGSNRLVNVPIFDGLPKLRVLDLRWNWIQSIKDRDVAGLESLERLDLGGNQISEVDSDAFSSLRRLEWLDLASNNLTSLELGTMDGFDVLVLSHLDLSVNPWNCTCSNYWLVLWLQLNNITGIVSKPGSTQCQSPVEWHGRTLLTVYDEVNSSCPFPFPVPTTEATALLSPTGSAKISGAGTLSKEARIGIIVASVVVGVLIIVFVGVIVHFRLKRIGFWNRKRSESVMHRDAAKNGSTASGTKLGPEVGSDGGYDNRWVISDDGSGQGHHGGGLEASCPESGSGDVGFAIVSRAGSPTSSMGPKQTFVYDNPGLTDDGRHM